MCAEKKRSYHSETREAQAAKTRSHILESAKGLFQTEGFDQVTISQLAEMVDLDRTTLARNLRPLQGRSLVRTRQAESDQRIRRVELTATGRDAAARAISSWRRAQSGVTPILKQFSLQGVLQNGAE